MNQLVEFIGNHLILVTLWIAVASFLIVLVMQGKLNGVKALSSQQTVNLMNRENAKVIDIRPVNEFKKGHIIDAINVPFSSFDEGKSKLEKFKDKPIVLACVAGLHSGQAGMTLKKSGFSQIYRLNGGMNAWINDKLPLHK
jgi:rhodanese-related sulfurtransferase